MFSAWSGISCEVDMELYKLVSPAKQISNHVCMSSRCSISFEIHRFVLFIYSRWEEDSPSYYAFRDSVSEGRSVVELAASGLTQTPIGSGNLL